MYAHENRPKMKKRTNPTGIPDRMKQQFEDLSGLSFGDVRVHYHSGAPAQRKAYAYTQGNQVYIASGQEKYLGHELGHVVQQKQGRVKPDYFRNGEAVNDNALLEREADFLAAAAERMPDAPALAEVGYGTGMSVRQDAPVQRTKWRYRQETGEWSEEGDEEGETPSPSPTAEETAMLLADAREGEGPLRDSCVDTASYAYLLWLADKKMYSYGGCRNHTLHSPGTTNDLGDRRVRNRLYEMYRDRDGAREPREYDAGEDIHRYLRWLSTFLSVIYKINGEIQCYYDKSSRRILVSTNFSTEISKLGRQLGKVEIDYGAGSTRRQRRHMQHIYQISGNLAHSGYAFAQIAVWIVGDVSVSNAHAEQRILNFLRHEPQERQNAMVRAGALTVDEGKLWLRPEYLGGIRRCCFACAYACFSAGDTGSIRRGPFWDSIASGVYMDSESIVRAAEGIRLQVKTHVTVQRSKEAKATTEYDTDSESDDTELTYTEEEDTENKMDTAEEEDTENKMDTAEEEDAENEVDTAMAEDMGNDLYLRIMDAFLQ